MSTKQAVKFLNELRFNLSPQDISRHCSNLINRSKGIHAKIGNLKREEQTFKNVVLPLALHEGEFLTQSSNITFPSYVSTSKDVRDQSSESNKLIEEYRIEWFMNEKVYEALKNVKETEWDSLNDSQRRILSRMLRDYERNGLALEKSKRERVKELKGQLSKLQIEFCKNIAEDKSQHEFTAEELDGMPQDYLDRLKKNEETGKYIVTLKYPEYFPLLKFCKVEKTRRIMEKLASTQCQDVNVKLFEEALKIRTEIASLMGYENHAAYVLETRMAKKPENVLKFLNDLKDKLYNRGKEELQILLKLKENEKNAMKEEFDGKINNWDMHYYIRMYKEKEYEIDENEITKYFPLENVLKGLFEIYQGLLGVKFVEVEEPHVWHEDVRMFNVIDAEDGHLVGQFYLDLFPRDGKYTHAAAFPLQQTFIKEDGTRQHPVSAMVCNFTKPTKTQPSLLKHSEVVTLFHEFGHVAHGFCSKANWGRFSSTSVERDFVECPSQLMENWCWEKKALKKMSGHYQTGEPLDDKIIERMVKSKNVMAGLTNLRQIFFGLFDMTSHISTKPFDSGELWTKLRQEITLIPNTEGTNPVSTFAHLMGGYDASYYGYLWAQVYSADMFSVFQEKGLFNSEVGKKFRKTVLEIGGEKDGDVIIRDFLGREPSQEPFLKSIGLK